MDFEEINLKLYLDELSISHDNKTLEERILIQKAVFIGQCAGLDLGFHYEWNRHGPYSRDLTPVYYRFNRHYYNDNERDYESYSLKEKVKSRISEFKGLLSPPDNVELERHQWTEFVASILYYMEKSNNNEEEAKIELKNSNKNIYCKYYPIAIAEIKKVDPIKNKYFSGN